MPVLLHLNGPPGIGKSTIARRYAADHPGVLHCDVDLLRTLVGGWSADWGRAGSLVRPAALGMIEAHLASGHDVVLPQLLVDPDEIARFAASASRAGAAFVERLLMDDPERTVARFHRRGADEPDDPWHARVRAIVAAQGGDDALRERHRLLAALAAAGPEVVVVPSVEGDVEGTYRRLLATL